VAPEAGSGPFVSNGAKLCRCLHCPTRRTNEVQIHVQGSHSSNSAETERVMKIVSVVGARPQFIKAAAVSRELRRYHREVLLHTGQHYDFEMSGTFFAGLGLPVPDVNLGAGGGSHATQTGVMLEGIEKVLLAERPDWLLIYGDTNSTLAGALAASKLSVPVVHIEAGLRSFNRRMPEEINRIVADHLSDLLLCPSDTAAKNLAAEGITRGVHVVGDVMLDVLNWANERLVSQPSKILETLGLNKQRYILATVHRQENTDNHHHLAQILNAFNSLDEAVIFAVHPRTRKVIDRESLKVNHGTRLIDPLGYLDMMALASSARLILTDSGGLQKEAYWLGVPCITMRPETEWIETVYAGWNILVGPDSIAIVEAVHNFRPSTPRQPLYGSGFAASKCVALLD
jgi:UDP-GlcNAc3NAcA epimerase